MGFWEALGDLQYDTNGDNYISIEEAFTEGSQRMKTKMKDRPDEVNPQYISIGICKDKQNKFLYK